MKVVCAPNAFKGTLSAARAAAALATGVRAAGADAVEIPVADGGDGTLDVLAAAHAQSVRMVHEIVHGPLDDLVQARIALLDGTTAVIELADAAGLRLLEGMRLNPLAASTFGVGELIAAAADRGVRRLLVGVGGSATVDGGLGLLEALGADIRDGDGHPIPPGGGATAWATQVDLTAAFDRVAGMEIVVLADVENPLTGEAGAARVFGPQKGADPRQVEHLERGLVRFAEILEVVTGRPGLGTEAGMGAAGGAAFGLACLGARVVRGAEYVCDEIAIDDALDGAALVITGEGRLDFQTASGKAPAEVASRALARHVPCQAVAGVVEDALPFLFAGARSLGTTPGDAEATEAALEAVATLLATDAVPGGR